MLRVLPRWVALLAVTSMALGWTAAARAEDPSLAADATRPGVIDLAYQGPVGARVGFFEVVDGAQELLGVQDIGPTGRVRLVEATTWSCDRVVRSFAAVARAPDASVSHGTFTVRTPSCKHRFDLSAPHRAAVGSKPRVRVTDRWGIGAIKPRLCIDPPQAKRTCRVLAFGKAVTIASRRFKADTKGRWRVELRVAGSKIRTSVAVGKGVSAGPKPPPTLLATGDSTMQGIDSFLEDRLSGDATVRSDVLAGTGLSQTPRFWIDRAAHQAAHLKPRTTVISIGANDFFDMKTPDGTTALCCGKEWIAEYTRRVRTMMRSYIRGGKGRVLWLTLPLPRDFARTLISATINYAIRQAAAGLKGAYVVGIDDLFTPHGFTDVIRWRGQDVEVREPDGIHLNVAGTSIAAEFIQAALKNLDM
jgi:lysophospholipase L1-like esterase